MGVVLILGAAWIYFSSGMNRPTGGAAGIEAGPTPGLRLSMEKYWWFIPVDVDQSVSTTVIVTSTGGFASDEVALSLDGMPPGIRAEFDPPVVSVPADGEARSLLTVHGSEEPFDEDSSNKFGLSLKAVAGDVSVRHPVELLLLCH